jgi:hypothetical protein
VLVGHHALDVRIWRNSGTDDIREVAPRTMIVLRRAVESESEGILGGVGVGKNVPIPTPTSI